MIRPTRARVDASKHPGRSAGASPPPGGANLLAAAAARAVGGELGEKRDLLRHASVTRFLADADERRELLVQRVDVLEMRIHDLEPQIAERIPLRETLEHHLPDTLRGNLGDAALPHRSLEVI